MRVLVTGATGFIGSHLVKHLLKKNCTVATLMRPSSDPWRIKDVQSKVKIIYGDLAEIGQISNEVQNFSPDLVFHLGWHGASSSRFVDDPDQAFQNVPGSIELLRLIAMGDCQRWVGLGSVLEYGRYPVPISENLPPQPTTLYGISKLSTCYLTQKLCNIYKISFAWLRLFWAYGPADVPNRMIPYVILSLLQGKKPILTPGKQLWDYLFIEDVVEALWQVATNPNVEGIFNLGSGRVHTIKSIVERIRDMIDPRLPLGLGERAYGPEQIMHLQADISKLRRATSWAPKVNIEEGLRRTVSWFRENQEVYGAT
jgi:nucleoside-diphosphate-sugar epimerase